MRKQCKKNCGEMLNLSDVVKFSEATENNSQSKYGIFEQESSAQKIMENPLHENIVDNSFACDEETSFEGSNNLDTAIEQVAQSKSSRAAKPCRKGTCGAEPPSTQTCTDTRSDELQLQALPMFRKLKALMNLSAFFEKNPLRPFPFDVLSREGKVNPVIEKRREQWREQARRKRTKNKELKTQLAAILNTFL